jgi:hypothetical protein
MSNPPHAPLLVRLKRTPFSLHSNAFTPKNLKSPIQISIPYPCLFESENTAENSGKQKDFILFSPTCKKLRAAHCIGFTGVGY